MQELPPAIAHVHARMCYERTWYMSHMGCGIKAGLAPLRRKMLCAALGCSCSIKMRSEREYGACECARTCATSEGAHGVRVQVSPVPFRRMYLGWCMCCAQRGWRMRLSDVRVHESAARQVRC